MSLGACRILTRPTVCVGFFTILTLLLENMCSPVVGKEKGAKNLCFLVFHCLGQQQMDHVRVLNFGVGMVFEYKIGHLNHLH